MACRRPRVRAPSAPLSSLNLIRVWPQNANGQSARDDRCQQPAIVEKPLPVLSHLIDTRQIGYELSEEEIRTESDPPGRRSRRKCSRSCGSSSGSPSEKIRS
jgi:hypothetical protein